MVNNAVANNRIVNPPSQGARATRTGKMAETTIAVILSQKGYSFKQGFRLCKSIYGHNLKTDFFITNIPDFPEGLAIESKWQQKAGSNDEKFPYLVTNIKNQFPCPAIVVVDGNGQKAGAIRWIKNQVDEKLIGVYSLAEFISYVNYDMPEPAKKETSEVQK